MTNGRAALPSVEVEGRTGRASGSSSSGASKEIPKRHSSQGKQDASTGSGQEDKQQDGVTAVQDGGDLSGTFLKVGRMCCAHLACSYSS